MSGSGSHLRRGNLHLLVPLLQPGIFFSFPYHKIEPPLLCVTVCPLMDRDSIAAIGVAGPPHRPIQNQGSPGLDDVQRENHLCSAEPCRRQDERRKWRPGAESSFPKVSEQHGSRARKEATPPGTPFSSCCGGPYVTSCSGKIPWFPLQLHLLLYCSFSCPVEGKAKLGDK